MENLIDKLTEEHSLSIKEYELLIKAYNAELAKKVAERAVALRMMHYGNSVFIRGLIEISNICKNDCLYCGIRRGNTKCERYRLTEKEIFECCKSGYELGFRTFVLQGGEDAYFTDEILCPLLAEIKQACLGCAITLSLGERSYESYLLLKGAGADRYLLRHETADKEHYQKLHPSEMSFENRIQCLKQLKELGYQTGCGFMVGSPFQTTETLAKDLKFVEVFKPAMCGIGPFIPAPNTPFYNGTTGSVVFTCYLLSLIRLIHPTILLPATTALGTLDPKGREKGILAGANVIMPNLSPDSARSKYKIYDGKTSNNDMATDLASLKASMQAIGYEIVTDRGDAISLRN